MGRFTPEDIDAVMAHRPLHGYVNVRPDGARNRCGGPALCTDCAYEVCDVCNRVGLDAVQYHENPHPV